MSLATRCTSCGTIFRVVQDQLKVSEGWVRCGRCQEVFNALEGLFDLEREPPPQRQPTATQAVAQSMAEFVASRHSGQSGYGLLDGEAVPSTHEGDAIESRFLALPAKHERAPREHEDFADARFPSELPLDAVHEDNADLRAWPEAEPAPAAADAVKKRRPLTQRWRERRETRESAAMSSLLEPSTEDAAPLEALPALRGGASPEFVRRAERAAQWQRPRVRASLVLASALLLGGLLTQIAVQHRDAFAAQWPESRPTLQALCEVMDCRIEALRRLASLSVEASGLTQIEGQDAYRLSLTLHNRSRVELAPPSVDLGITDATGTLIARRSLSPGEFRVVPGGALPGLALAPGAETQWQALLSTGGAGVSGYTVDLFYP